MKLERLATLERPPPLPLVPYTMKSERLATLERPPPLPLVPYDIEWRGLGRRSFLFSGLHMLVPLAVLVAWALTIQSVPLRRMNDLGLVSVLPLPSILLLVPLTVSFCLSLRRRPLQPWVPPAHVLALIVMLYGITTFIEPEPRVEIVYKHVGVIGYILGHGSVDPRIDAYFNWPGFFALGALLAGAAGFHSALPFASWGPILYNLLYLPPLVVIFRWAGRDARVTWLAAWLFYAMNWVAQDHISPQATGYLMWLSMLAALLTWFTPRPRPRAVDLTVRRVVVLLRAIPRTLLRSDAGGGGDRRPGYQRVVVLLLVLAMYAATVTGHQLTPVPAILTVIGLVVLVRLEPRRLPLIMIVLLAVWLSYMTVDYLEGNIHTLLGAVGQVSQTVGAGVTGRLAEGSSQHHLIVELRVVASLAIWLLALGGFGRRFALRHADVGMAVVGVAPFLLPALQPYGGEIFLRVFLFALPAVAFFISGLVFPTTRAGRGWAGIGIAVALSCLLLGLFQFTRYGNERLDNFTRGDVAVVQRFYRVAPRGSTVYAGDYNMPWRYRDYAGYHYQLISDLNAWANFARPNPHVLEHQLQQALAAADGGYVIITHSTEVAADLLEGRPGALQALLTLLRSSPGVRELYANRDGELFYVR